MTIKPFWKLGLNSITMEKPEKIPPRFDNDYRFIKRQEKNTTVKVKSYDDGIFIKRNGKVFDIIEKYPFTLIKFERKTIGYCKNINNEYFSLIGKPSDYHKNKLSKESDKNTALNIIIDECIKTL